MTERTDAHLGGRVVSDGKINSLVRLVQNFGDTFFGSHLYLIGSLATGEFLNSSRFGSDIDLLAIGHDAREQAASASELRRKLNNALSAYSDLATFRVGYRYRTAGELPRFQRYLALQGFHASWAISLEHCSSAAPRLRDPSFIKADANELACITLEVLWGEMRGRLAIGAQSAYANAKSVLNYANILLVAHGTFKPTHATRLAALSTLKLAPGLFGSCQLAYKLKTAGILANDTSVFDELARGCSAWRETICKFVFEHGGVEEGVTDPAEFWVSDAMGKADRVVFSRELGIAIWEVLKCAPDKKLPVLPASLSKFLFGHASSLARCAIHRPLAFDAVVAQINSSRIRQSAAARRDWG